MAPAVASFMVADAPVPALVAACALETFPTHSGAWVRCHANDWQQLSTPTAASSLRWPHEVR